MGINFGGLASGLDTASIIDALVEVARQPIRTLKSKKHSLNSKLSAYGKLSSQLSQLRTAAKDMDTEAEFRTLSATSSNDSLVSAVASSAAGPGVYTLTVNNLAQAERTYSDPFASKNTVGLFGSGTLTFQSGAGTPVNVTVDSTDTLESVSAKINTASTEVTSSVVYDGTNYRMVVTGNQTGAANGITFTENGTLVLNLDSLANEQQAALDASVTMDSLVFTSTTNQMTEMIPGVTVDLHDASGGAVTIAVDVDATAMAAKVQTLVDKYNDIASFLHTQFQYGGSPRTDTLMGDATARNTKATLQSIIISEVTGIPGTHTQLASVGIKTSSDGTLLFNTADFNAALGADRQGVIALFTKDDGDPNLDEDGVAARLGNAIEVMLQNPDGLIAIRQDGLGDSIAAADDRIVELERRIENYQGTLLAQFSAMEQAMAEYQNTSSFLAQQSY